MARGESRPDSDVDFLVEFGEERSLFDLIGMRLDLREFLGTEVEIVTPNSLRYLRDHILAEATPL